MATSKAATLPYTTLDVFTKRPFSGNQLAVVREAEGLGRQAMQTIAAEFGYSETVFVTAEDPAQRWARLAIFTPKMEIPFAGHPVIGAAVELARRYSGTHEAPERCSLGLETGIGSLDVTVEPLSDDAPGARFSLDQMPKTRRPATNLEALAAALTLDDGAIDAERVLVSDLGVGFTIVPLRQAGALSAIQATRVSTGQLAAAGDPQAVYCVAPPTEAGRFQVRMFAPELGVREDPATGSAATAFAGWIALFEPDMARAGPIRIEQGRDLGRPSEITLSLTMTGDTLQAIELGGHAVPMAEGRMRTQ